MQLDRQQQPNCSARLSQYELREGAVPFEIMLDCGRAGLGVAGRSQIESQLRAGLPNVT